MDYRSNRTDNKNNRIIILCWWIFGISLFFSIVTTFEAWPFALGNEFDKFAAKEYINNLSIGLFCSTALVLFVERYHYKKDKQTKEHNRIILLNALVDSIKDNYANTFKRVAITHLYSGIEYSLEEDIDMYLEAVKQEERFLEDRNGSSALGEFIFVTDSTYDMMIANQMKGKVQTKEEKEHLILVKLYRDSINNIQKIRKKLSLEQLGSYKIAEVINAAEHDVLNHLYLKTDELFEYLKGKKPNIKKSIKKYNAIQYELVKLYNLFATSKDG